MARWAQCAASVFSDGQVVLDARRGAGPALAAGLRALGVPGEEIGPTTSEMAGLWRTLTCDRRLLIVAEDAATPQDVRPLYPGPGYACLVTTATRPMPELVLDAVAPVPVAPLAADDARELLCQLLPRVAGDVDCAPILSAAQGVPLTLGLLAGRLQHTPHPPNERNSTMSVESAATAALQSLPESERRRSLLLAGAAPVQRITVAGSAALWEATEAEAISALDVLAASGLLVPLGEGVLRLPAQVRQAARHLASEGGLESAIEAAKQQVTDYYATASTRYSLALLPDRLLYDADWADANEPGSVTPDAAAAWFSAEENALAVVLVRAAAAGQHRAVLRIVEAVRPWLHRAAAGELWAVAVRTGRAAAEAVGDPRALCLAHNVSAALHLRQGAYEEAVGEARASLAAAEQTDDEHLIGTSHEVLGAACSHAGRHADAIAHHRAALAGYAGTRRGAAIQASALARALIGAEELAEGIALARQAARDLEEIGDLWAAAKTTAWLARGLLEASETDAAEQTAERALALAEQAGSAYYACQAQLVHADIAHRRGDHDTEAQHLSEALGPLTTLAPTQADAIRTRLDSFR